MSLGEVTNDGTESESAVLAGCPGKSEGRHHGSQTVELGARAPRKIPQLLDRHFAPRRAPASHARLGHLVARHFLVQHRRARKAKNIAVNPHCVIATEKADEAVILEGTVEEIKDRAIWKTVCQEYDRKYGGNVLPLLASSGGNVYRVQPRMAFGQDEHAENFTESVTRWTFD